MKFHHIPSILLIVLILLAAYHPSVVEGKSLPVDKSLPPAVFTPDECPFNNASRYQIDCGYLSVPEDHAVPEGKQIKLAVAIAHSPNPNKSPDPVLYLQGGPGGEMLSIATYLVSHGAISTMLLQRDVIMVDQRGIGFSQPVLRCDVYHSGSEIFSLSAQEVNQRLIGCPAQFEAQGINWRVFTTEQNAADLAMVGPALGYEKVNLFGVSYGTLLGLIILRDHPEVVRSAVLDSVLPPNTSVFEESAQWLNHTFLLVEEHCQADLACRLAYPKLRQRMIDTYNRLQAQPAAIEINGETFSITSHYFAQHGGSPASRYDVEALPAFITAIANEDYEVTRAFLEAVQKAGWMDMPNLALFISMGCPYYATSTTPERMTRTFAQYAEPFREGRFTVNDWQRCQLWGELPVASRTLPQTDLPVLLLSGMYDALTPPAWAREAAQGLSNSTVVEIPYTSHNVTGVGGAAGECSLQMLSAFYADPSAPVDTGCLEDIPAPAFVLHTTVTRLPVQVTAVPLLLASVFSLGWAGYAWGRKPRWVAWRAAFRHMGPMPLLSLVVVVGLSLLVAPQEEDLLRNGIVSAIVPLFMALQAAAIFSPEEEPTLEITLATARPLAWLIVERLVAVGITYAVIAIIGTALTFWRHAAQFDISLQVSWLAPALFLSGIGLYVSLRTRVVAFGVVIVLALWIVFGLFGRFFLPGLAVPAPLNLIQPFLWPLHVHASRYDLVSSDFWLNRLFLSGAGITLILLAVRSLGDSENVLLNAHTRKTVPRSEHVPPEQPLLPNRKRDMYRPVAVRPHLVAQIAGIAIYEFRMLWRQRVMRVFAITPVVLFLFMVAINMFDKMGSGAIVSLLPPEQGALVYGEFVVSMTATFIIAMVLWLYPLLVANQVPSDQRIGVAELLRALPMNDSTYLFGKTLGAILAGASALVLAAIIYAVVWFLRVGPFYLVPLLSILSLCLLLLLVSTSQGILLGATQTSTPRALAVVLALLIVPEFLQAIPIVQQFLPGSADFLTLSVNRSLESIMVMPPLRRGFDPLEGTLAALYIALLIKTVFVALLVWAWRRLKK